MMQSPPTARYNKAFGSIIKRFIRVIESLVSIKDQNDQHMILKIEHTLIHELSGVLSTIFNNGIDNSSYENQLTPHMSTPIISNSERSSSMYESSRCYFTLFNILMPQRRSLRYVNTLTFLKNDKLKGSIWLLCELSDGHIIEIFDFFGAHQEFQNKYYQHSIMKVHHEEIREYLDLIYSGMFQLEGEVIQRYQEFCDNDQLFQIKDSLVASSVQTRDFYNEEDFKTPRHTTIQTEIVASAEVEPNNIAITNELNQSAHSKEDAYKGSNMKMLDVKTKNSVLLYNSQYEKYAEDTTFQRFQKQPKVQKLSVQNYICYSCQTQISQGFYPFISSTAELCIYSGQWFCKACMHKEGIIIPYKAVKEFDLKPYPVSKISFSNIKALYHKPILVLHYFEDIVFANNQLHDFLLMKRQLHLMYDSYCRVEILDQITELKGRKNLLLTMNLFSMQDLEQIKDGSLGAIIQIIYRKILRHMLQCELCQQNAFDCPGCSIKTKIFAFDIINTQYCRACKNLYHRACFPEECNICLQKTSQP